MFKTNIGSQLYYSEMTSQAHANNQIVRHSQDQYLKVNIMQNMSYANISFLTLSGLGMVESTPVMIQLNGIAASEVLVYWNVTKSIINKINTSKYVVLDENGFWILNISETNVPTFVDINKTYISSTMTGGGHIIPLDLENNIYVLVSNDNKIQKFQISSSGALSLLGSQVDISGTTNNYRICKLTGNRYFIGNTSKYQILNSTFGAIVGETDISLATQGNYYNNFKNINGSDYMIFKDSSDYVRSITVNSDNSITIASPVTASGTGVFTFLNDTTGYGGQMQGRPGYGGNVWSYIVPFELDVGSVILGTPTELAHRGETRVTNFYDGQASFTGTDNPNVFIGHMAGGAYVFNLGNGYAPSWEVILSTKTGTDPFNRVTISYSAALEPDTSYKYYYTLDNIEWTEYTAASGTEITVPSSVKLGLRAVGATTNSANRATLDYLYATVRQV